MARAFGLKKGVPCTQWVYGGSQPPRVPQGDVRPITEEYIPLCAAHYHPEDDEAAYLRSRMEAGQLWGLFEDGQLAAFIGVHHVYEDNPASHALQKKLGLTPAPDPVVWCWRPHEDGEADQ